MAWPASGVPKVGAPVAIDIDDKKLEFAAGIGADALINASRSGAVAEDIRTVTGGGAHVSMDALGSTVTCTNSVDCLRKRGKHIQVAYPVEWFNTYAGLRTAFGDLSLELYPLSRIENRSPTATRKPARTTVAGALTTSCLSW